MKLISTCAALWVIVVADAMRALELPALRIQGTKLVDANGKIVQLRGVNLGCWLVLEPHFLGMSFRDEKSLWEGVERRVGVAKTVEIREAYRTHWISAEDFKNVKQMGLNHVRVPFLATMLEADDAPGRYKDEGWKWLDRAVEWSEGAGLYCVLDLHGAPGCQSKADHTGQRDRNELWSVPANRERTVNLWRAIAMRYKGRSSIAAFDLINEPMDAPDAKTIFEFQMQLTRAIREVDLQRLVIVEDGYKGLEQLAPPMGSDKNGVIVSVHVYPTIVEAKPSPAHHERYFKEQLPKLLQEQTRLGQPFYIGEWNVVQEEAGGAPMIARHVAAMDKAGWSWALWIYKEARRDGVKGIWSIYRNTKKVDMPNFDKDDAETLVRKMSVFSSKAFERYEPVAKALGAP